MSVELKTTVCLGEKEGGGQGSEGGREGGRRAAGGMMYGENVAPVRAPPLSRPL